jgi:hypothetical protein
MQRTLIAPGAKRLKLKYDEPLSNFAFNFNLCRYSMGDEAHLLGPTRRNSTDEARISCNEARMSSPGSLFSGMASLRVDSESSMVWWNWSAVSTPELKAHMVLALESMIS